MSVRNLLGSLPFLLLLSACAEGTSLDPAALQDDRSMLKRLILDIKPALLPSAKAPTETGTVSQAIEVHGDTVTQCTFRRFSGVAVYDSLVSFDPNADALFPGSIVQTSTLPDGLLTPIALPRTPGTITLSNAVLGDESAKYSRLLQTPNQASAQNAIANILGGQSINLAAKANFVSEQAHSLEQAALKAGVSVRWLTGGVKANFDTDWRKHRSSFIVRFTQSYYTVSFEAPASPDAFFAPEVKAADAAPYMGPNNPPGYVASVTYGRMLFVKVESDADESEVKGAIDASFQAGFVAGGKANLSDQQKKVMNEATVTVFALGGSPQDAVEIMTSNRDRPEKIQAYFQKGAAYSANSPGVPISYTVRRLSDNQIVKVASTIDYSVPDCSPQQSQLQLTIDGFTITGNGASGGLFGGGSNDISYKIFIDDELISNGTAAKVRDGDTIAIGEQRLVARNKTNGLTFTVRAEITGGDTAVSPQRTHTFILDPSKTQGSWTQMGDNAIQQGSDKLEATLKYSVSGS